MISVIVPVYNEAENIGACLTGIASALCDAPHEILVCHDAPEDTTLPAIERIHPQPAGVRLVHNTLGRGAAYAIRAGLAAAQGDVLVVTMADLSDDPRVIPAMAAKVRAGAAVVAGSRYMPGGGQEGGPPLKRFLARLAGQSLRVLAGLGTHDVTNTFRAYSRDYMGRVIIESDQGFEISLELTAKAHLMGLPVDEVPTVWRDRTAGASRFRLWRWLPLYLRWYLLTLFGVRASSPWLFLAAWAFVWLGIASFPLRVAGESVDMAWPVMLADGFSRRWAGGVDTAFTYGPFGWVYGAAYLPGLFYPVVVLDLAFKAVLAWWVARAGFLLPPVSCAAFLGLVAWVGREDALLWLGFLLAWRGLAHPAPRWRHAVACAWLAFLGLVKSTFLVVSAAVLVLHTVRYARRARDAAFVAVAWAAAVACGWMAASGRLAGFPEWIVRVLEIVRGYPEGMGSWDRPGWELALAVAAALALALWRRRELTLLDALVGFAVFKQAFVRHDAYHSGSFWAWLVLWPLVAAVPRRVALASAFVGMGMLATLRDLPFMARAPYDNARYLASLPAVRAGVASLWERYRAGYALPVLAKVVGRGSVDVLPGSQVGVLLLNGFDYRPRPLFSYKTLTPALAEANAAFFRSERAPDFVLEAPLAVDGRWPAGEDAPARLEVSLRYDRVAEERGYVLLARRATPRPAPARRPLLRRPLAFGEPLDLSAHAGRRLWLSARFALTPVGRLVTLALKSPAICMRVGNAQWRVVPGSAVLGFEVPPALLSFICGPVGASCYVPAIEVSVDALQEAP